MFTRRNYRLPSRLAAVMGMALFMLSCSTSMVSVAGSQPRADRPVSDPIPQTGGGGNRYIVQLTDPGVAVYAGGVPGLPPTSPAQTKQRLNLASPAVRAYRAYLSEKREQFRKKAEQVLCRQIVFDNHFDMTIHAIVMRLTVAEASTIEKFSEVRGVTPDRKMELHTVPAGNPDRSAQ